MSILKKLVLLSAVLLLTMYYGEKTREKGFKTGLEVGKTKALKEEGYSVQEIYERTVENPDSDTY